MREEIGCSPIHVVLRWSSSSTRLVDAFDRFDPEQNSCATFAWITMSGLLRRHLRDHGWSIRPPRPLQESANKLRKVTPELTQDLGRTPRTADAAERFG